MVRAMHERFSNILVPVCVYNVTNAFDRIDNMTDWTCRIFHTTANVCRTMGFPRIRCRLFLFFIRHICIVQCIEYLIDVAVEFACNTFQLCYYIPYDASCIWYFVAVFRNRCVLKWWIQNRLAIMCVNSIFVWLSKWCGSPVKLQFSRKIWNFLRPCRGVFEMIQSILMVLYLMQPFRSYLFAFRDWGDWQIMRIVWKHDFRTERNVIGIKLRDEKSVTLGACMALLLVWMYLCCFLVPFIYTNYDLHKIDILRVCVCVCELSKLYNFIKYFV